MAQSRFTAFLQRVRLLVTGQAVKERRQELGHQFTADASPAGRLGHEFAVGSIEEVILSHTLTVPGIVLTSGLNHELNVNELHKTSILTGQFNISHLNKERILGHTFSIPLSATSGLHHEFTGSLAASSGLNQEFNVPSITTTAVLNQQFSVNEINVTTTLRHSFGVTQDGSSTLSNTFAVQQTTTTTLEHEINVSLISSSSNLNHELDVDHISKTKVLGHTFGIEHSLEVTLAHSFGVSSQPQASELQHQFGIYGIIVTSGLQHQFNVPLISDKGSVLGHQFGLELTDDKTLFHQFTLAYDASEKLDQEFNIDLLNKTAQLGHAFQMNVTKSTLGHTFSAIGVAQVEANLSHQFSTTYILPSYVLQHQFNLVFALPLPDPVIHSGELKFIYDESNELTNGVFSGVNYSASYAASYSDPVANPITSSGTWFGVDPNSVIPDVASGLNEADFFHGTFMFHNDLFAYPSGSITTIPEYLSDTIFLRQAWNSPVVTSGYEAWWGINDFPIGLSEITLIPAGPLFGAFFGRQVTISGLTTELFGLFDPALQLSGDVSHVGRDPFTFHAYDLSGEIKLTLDREFMISGIYVTQPNGSPGSALKRKDTVVRLGFTYHEQDYQPEELSWSLGVNTPPDVFTQVQSTDQWTASGLFRDFAVSPLRGGDNIRGRIRAFSPKQNTSFTGTYPLHLLDMASSDMVNLRGGGMVVWPDIGDIERILDIEYTVSGLDRSRIPAMLTIKHESINAQPKVLRLFRQGANTLEGSILEIPVNLAHGNELGTLKIITDFSQPVTVSGQLGNTMFTTYKREDKNAIPKVIFTDEESD